MNSNRFRNVTSTSKYLQWLLIFLVFWNTSGQLLDYSEKEITIHSKILNEERMVKMYFPKENDKDLIALYIIDGNWNYELVKGMVAHWARWNQSPNIVVISLDNMGSRTRDLTPTNDEERYPGSGGASLFLSFIKDELRPLMNKEFGNIESEILFGHSFGGLFSLYTLKEDPTLFDGYIAVSPSVWWKDRFMFGAYNFKAGDVKPFVYATAGTNDRGNTNANKEYVDWLKAEGHSEKIELHTDIFDGENHFTNVPITLHHAFSKLFAKEKWSKILVSAYDEGGLETLKSKVEQLKKQYGVRFSIPTDVMLAKSLELNENQSYVEAVELLKWLQSEVKDEYQPPYYLAYIYENQKDSVNAIGSYEAALQTGSMPKRMRTVINKELQKLKAPSHLLIPFSTDEVETSIAFSPNEKTAYVSRHKGKWGNQNNPPSKIYKYQKTNNTWELKGLAFMSNPDGDYSDSDIFISYDGKELFFISNRPYGGKTDGNPDIWKSTLVNGKWTDPRPILEVNSNGYESSPVTDMQGNLYFSSIRKEGKGLGDFYMAKRKKDGSYEKPEALKGKVNTSSGEWNLIVSPNADWMVFESSGREDGLSPYGDLYLSKKSNGVWTKPIHLKEVNSTGSDLNPRYLGKSKKLVFISSKYLKSTNASIYEMNKDLWHRYLQAID